MKFDREKAKEDLLKRTKESYNSKDFAGAGPAYLKPLPRPFWKCKEGKHIFDLIPWVASDKYPSPKGEIKPGDIVYKLDIWVHQNVGPMDIQVLCPAYNYGERCPVCEKVKELRSEDAPKEKLDPIRAKRRTIYNMFCFDNNVEEAKGVQVWEVAHFFIEQKLASLSERPRGGGHIIFADPDSGMSISFERKGSGPENTQYLGHQFVLREGYVVEDELLDQAVPLEEYLIRSSYDELYALFYGTAPKEQTATEEPGFTPSRLRSRTAPAQGANISGEDKCPAGGTFGKDVDKLIQCNTCDVYNKCALFSEKAAEETKQPDQTAAPTTLRRRRNV